MFSFKKSLTLAAGVAGAFAFGASNVSADTTNNTPADYVVKSGDTLNKLSQEFKISVDDIATNNNISDVDVIFVGQRLLFTEKAPVAQAPAAQAPAAQVTPTSPVAQAPAVQAPVAPVVQAPAQPAAPAQQPAAGSTSAALDALINKESSGNVNASNGQYFGIGQLSPQARAQYGGNSTDYNDQLNAMKSYINARYGSAENAWAHSQATGWY
ncbi:LysM peptidoglycan-binding domain-containing protein [Leuconostoc miyukkimchii]|uniref:LysM peptidoglycan-binding domain-containing protein n=1 Tax=Leuconostoc miyukkimchii TaxID=910540 RepID=UPI001C7DFB72|nr:LysM domain-containing protein [Leuconostoc miyukkimchii]